jgi:hypothetical protein
MCISDLSFRLNGCACVLFALAFFDFSIWTTTVTEYAGSPLCTQVDKYYDVINIYTYLDAVITLILPTTVLVILIGAIIVKFDIIMNRILLM